MGNDLSDDGQRFTVTRDGSGLLLQTSTLTTYEDGSTSETVRYSDGRTIRTNAAEDGTITSRARIEFFEDDNSRVETITYADGRIFQVSYDGEGNLLTRQEIESGSRTLQNAINQYGGTLLDALTLVNAIRSGQPLPIVSAFADSRLRLADRQRSVKPERHATPGAFGCRECGQRRTQLDEPGQRTGARGHHGCLDSGSSSAQFWCECLHRDAGLQLR